MLSLHALYAVSVVAITELQHIILIWLTVNECLVVNEIGGTFQWSFLQPVERSYETEDGGNLLIVVCCFSGLIRNTSD